MGERKARDVMDDLLEGATSEVSEERIAKWLVTRLLTIINTPPGAKKDHPLLDEELLFLYGVRTRFGWSQAFLSKIAVPIVKDMTASSEKAKEFFEELVKTQAMVN